MDDIQVCPISVKDTAVLRRNVLSWSTATISEDSDAHHWGAFSNRTLIGIVSALPAPAYPADTAAVRFYGLAVHDNFQRAGVGGHLVATADRFAATIAADRLWASSRLSAVPFYLRLGFTASGKRLHLDHKSGLWNTVVFRPVEKITGFRD